ncbi:rifin [Plasmodium falciparum RAJ116]|uniref:Rifin n=1 Tax=Plasmodium falciparum RAJ116 TaxID=580058 RepID=A0A0L0CRZ8_PLAFA|nr:rifin [Plasmodium falciparum RAJ116]
MKVHYINILLFALPLNILVNTHKKPSITPHTQTNRLLCECELYAPTNYDNDPEMKRVMQQFHDRTTQRFQEYDERLQEKRQICKDKCDKEIQKIILKDKLEKQMEQQLTTLETKIDTDDIPTCICEKTMADKTEKFCLNCGVNVGGGVTLSSGVLGGIGAVAVNAWKDAALKAAIVAAQKAGAAAGKVAGDIKGMEIVRFGLKHFRVDELFPGIFNNFVNTRHYSEVANIASTINSKYSMTCLSLNNNFTAPPACTKFQLSLRIHLSETNTRGTPAAEAIPNGLRGILADATKTAKAAEVAESTRITAVITKKQTALIEAGFNSSTTSIYASIIAILIIVLIMVIIYLILRYRRKKKMKKKLQYIKLLEE